jgi:hypothetical protein
MAEADHPWFERTHQSFHAAIANDAHGHEESTFFGPLTPLYHFLRPLWYYTSVQVKSPGGLTREKRLRPYSSGGAHSASGVFFS